jgi:cell division septation protein DedD
MGKKEKASPEKNESPPSPPRKGLAVWIGLTLFACGWMFVLGILVGRETVPVKFDVEKLQNELAALKEAVVKKELYETLKKTGSDDDLKVDIPTLEAKPLDEQKTEPGTKKTSVPKEIESEKRNITPPPKVASETEKTDPPKKLGTPQKKKTVNLNKTAEGHKNFTIQIASLKDSVAADNMVAKLKKKGYPAYRSLGKVPDKGIWFRVRVGYFKNRDEARGTVKRLKNEKIEGIIVQR